MPENFDDILRDSLNREPVPGPHEGHEERFARRLNQDRREKKSFSIPRWSYIAVAAASVAALIITLVISEIQKTNQEFSSVRLSDLSYEMAEVERFYTTRLESTMPRLDYQDETIRGFTTQLTKLEEEYRELEKALAVNTSNQRVIDAMVENYRFRLRIMEMLQAYIEMKNSTNQNENEKVSAS